MLINHENSKTKNLTVKCSTKSDLNLANTSLQRVLHNKFDIKLKLTTHQAVVAEAMGFSNHNDLLHRLPIEVAFEDFIEQYHSRVNVHSSMKLSSESDLVYFADALLEKGLARKLLIVVPLGNKIRNKQPLYESMGWREFDRPFPVCIFLDHRTNEVYLSKTPKIYGAPSVVYGLEETYNMPVHLDKNQYNNFLWENQHEFEEILNQSWIDYDGRNWTRFSTEKGAKLRHYIANQIELISL